MPEDSPTRAEILEALSWATASGACLDFIDGLLDDLNACEAVPA